MAVSYVNNATANAGNTASTPAWPASLVAGNAIIMHCVNKPFSDSPTAPAGFTQLATATSGSVANGVSTGSVRGTCWSYDVIGTESVAPSVTQPTGTPILCRMQQFAKGTDPWDFLGTVLSDTDETGTGVSASGSQIDITSGDFLAIMVGMKDDAITHTSQSFSVPGCTLGTITWDAVFQSSSGNDAGLYTGRVQVTAGSATGGPSYTATSSVSGASACAVTVARLREVVPSATLRPRRQFPQLRR